MGLDLHRGMNPCPSCPFACYYESEFVSQVSRPLRVLKHINYEFRLFSGFLLPRLFIYYRFCECGLGNKHALFSIIENNREHAH